MDRERGDEIPYGEPPNAYRRNPPGKCCRLTAAEIAEVRDVYGRWIAVRDERIRLRKRLGLARDHFKRVGAGTVGKNPRA